MNKLNEPVAIIGAKRTPVGKFGGGLASFAATELGSIAAKAAIIQSGIDSREISLSVFGQVLQAGCGQNPARQVALGAGLQESSIAFTLNMVCGSGLKAIHTAAQSIRAGEHDYAIAGGMESMSRAPYYSQKSRWGVGYGNMFLEDGMLVDGLTDAYSKKHMGEAAEWVAEKYKISRDEQDNFSLNSQKKTEKAYSENKFQDELIKLQIEDGDKKFIFEKDEHPRENLSIDDLKKLKTVFKENGTVTPGNSSGINDGAAALVLMSREQAEKKSLEPLVKIVSWATCGVEPSLMGLGPIPSIQEALSKANWKIDEVDLFEINEAFAAQSIAVIEELKIPEQKVNVNGGAIALGHPIGASGARILVTLVHEMIKQDKKKGCAALCIGGGMGIAMCIERS